MYQHRLPISAKGFTLIEILIAMSILLVGLTGILSLFPIGLQATKKAVESSTAVIVTESVHASLRASVNRMLLNDNQELDFFHDGVGRSKHSLPKLGEDPLFIPAADEIALLGKEEEEGPYHFRVPGQNTKTLQQYGFRIKIVPTELSGLYEVNIDVFRVDKRIHQYRTRLTIPSTLGGGGE